MKCASFLSEFLLVMSWQHVASCNTLLNFDFVVANLVASARTELPTVGSIRTSWKMDMKNAENQ